MKEVLYKKMQYPEFMNYYINLKSVFPEAEKKDKKVKNLAVMLQVLDMKF